MRKIMVFAAACLFLAACKKDKFTTAPQIKYKSISPTSVSSGVVGAAPPVLTLSITDSEGDLGRKAGKDTSWIYIKSLLNNKLDSFLFPDIELAGKKNFQADVLVNLPLYCKPRPGGVRHVDTLFYDVYVKDFAENKSNTIRTENGVLFTCQ